MKPTLGVLLTLLLTACAGYQFEKKSNPLFEYGIKSVSIPMFVNYSPLPGVSASLTRRMHELLSSYEDLKVYSGESDKVDAIVIGIIGDGKQKVGDVNTTLSKEFTSGDLEESIGVREQFFLPSTNKFSVNVRIVIIKNPTFNDKKVARSKFAKFLLENNKVIVNETLTLSNSNTLVLNETKSINSPGLFNLTKSKGLLSIAIDDASSSLVKNFKEVVLNAF